VDIKQYFRKIREAEATISENFPVVISRETSDGGKAGIPTEVSRSTAAKMIVEGCAVLASEPQAAEYRAQQRAAKEAFDAAELSRRVQIAIVDHAPLSSHKDKKATPVPGSGK
jgi:hypothetical protein